MKKILIYSHLFLLFAASCKKKDEAPISSDPVANYSMELRDLSDFPVGMQTYIGILDYPVPKERVVKSFDSYTLTTLYWTGSEPKPDSFNFSMADKCLDFAQNNNKRLLGHLLYFQHSVTPDYIKNFSGDQAAFEATVKNHIQTIVTRYKGQIAGYDVINELVDFYKGTLFFNNILEQFYQNDAAYIDFVANCFTWAHEADPDAKLFYNEANLELNDHKRLEAVIALVQGLQAKGAPIHGIGTQMHTDIYCPISTVEYTLRELTKTGLLVYISELDVSVNNDSNLGENLDYQSLNNDLAERQRAQYKAIVYAYRQQVPAAQQWGITMWDLMDSVSWLNQFRKEWPCLYDGNADKKPAFLGFAEGLLKN